MGSKGHRASTPSGHPVNKAQRGRRGCPTCRGHKAPKVRKGHKAHRGRPVSMGTMAGRDRWVHKARKGFPVDSGRKARLVLKGSVERKGRKGHPVNVEPMAPMVPMAGMGMMASKAHGEKPVLKGHPAPSGQRVRV